MSKRLQIVSLLVLGLVTSTQFINCSEEGLPDNIDSYSALGTTLKANAVPQYITPADQSQIVVSGGTPPYAFSISSGTATVSTTGVVTPGGLGGVMVLVTDKNGNSVSLALGVVTTTGGGSGGAGSCTTPWGLVVANGQPVTGFSSATAACPASCTQVTATCSNGTFTGGTLAANTCTLTACQFKKDAIYACPHAGYGAVVSALPACTAANYHQYICVANPAMGFDDEYFCAGGAEAVGTTNYTPAPTPIPSPGGS